MILNKIPVDMTQEEVSRLDEMYTRDYPKYIKNEMKGYSENSNSYNTVLRNDVFEELLNKGVPIEKVINKMTNIDFEKKFIMSKEVFLGKINNLSKTEISLKEPTILYRGLNENIEKYKIGDIFIDNGFSSTSFSNVVARGYAGDKGFVEVIHAEKNTLGSYIRQNSKHPEHIEFKLPAGSSRKVTFIDFEKKEIHTKIIRERFKNKK
jgi:hypothetical protein